MCQTQIDMNVRQGPQIQNFPEIHDTSTHSAFDKNYNANLVSRRMIMVAKRQTIETVSPTQLINDNMKFRVSSYGCTIHTIMKY